MKQGMEDGEEEMLDSCLLVEKIVVSTFLTE